MQIILYSKITAKYKLNISTLLSISDKSWYFFHKKGHLSTTRGGTVVSPLIGQVIEQSLNYLKIPRDYENQIEKNLRWFLDTPTYKVPNYIGKTKKEIKLNQFYKYQFYGEGNTVIYQSPNPGEKIKEGDTIMFYLG